MTRDEVDIAIQWAAQEGWNPGLHDADCYYAIDPTGFLMGFLGDEPIASISVLKYGQSFGFVGFYIVKPKYRGKGFGKQIWNAGMAYLAGRNVGLDGVVTQQDNYQKSGFKLAYRNIRFEGVGGGEVSGSGLLDLVDVPLAKIIEYDQPFFPDDRTEFIQCWAKLPQSHGLAAMNLDQITGYGVIRKCRSGYKVGPLFADDPATADALFRGLKAKVSSGDPVYLDTPANNEEAVALAERHGMTLSFETARMYTGAFPDLPIKRLFGVTSFEVG